MRRALPAVGLIGAGIAIYGAAQALGLRRARAAARARLVTLPVRRIALSHGDVAYIDRGPGRERTGETIGGCTQGCHTFCDVVHEVANGIDLRVNHFVHGDEVWAGYVPVCVLQGKMQFVEVVQASL